MANVDQNDEPSMEDILASIRKIIADDDEGGADASAAAGLETAGEGEEASSEDIDAMFSDAAADMADDQDAEEDAVAEDSSDVFELTSDMAVEGDVMFAEDNFDAGDDEAEDPFSAVDGHPVGEHEPDVEFVNNPPQPEIVNRVASAATSAFLNGKGPEGLLSSQTQASVASAFGNLAHTVLSKDARTLEDLVKEMLRPMLKTWLDDNLPQMVERMVREEIERLSRGGMR